MSDIADIAQEHIEREQVALLAQRKPRGPIANGRCHFCDEIVGDEHRWCNVDCRSDWERDQLRGRFKVDEE